MVDRYSRKTYAVATTSMTSSVVVRALTGIFAHFGNYTYICGDNQASLLNNREIKTFTSKWGAAIKTGIPYNSRSQSLIESHNASIKFMIKSLCLQNMTKDWPSLVPLCLYLLNTNPNTGLPDGMCPDQVHFGREIVLYPVMKHKVSGHILQEDYFEITQRQHEMNKQAILKYHNMRKRFTLRDSQNKGTPFSPGKYVYFRRLNLGKTPGIGQKYVNTVYRIEKCFHSLVEIRDIFKLTDPPWTLTTTIYFLKPFTERSSLYKYIQPDQRRIGGVLREKDLPIGEQEMETPDVYDPTSRQAKEKIILPSGSSSSSDEETVSESEEDIESGTNEKDNNDLADLPTPKQLETEVQSNPVPNSPNLLPRERPSMPNISKEKQPLTDDLKEKTTNKTSKNLGKWLKEAISLPKRQTRSGLKLG